MSSKNIILAADIGFGYLKYCIYDSTTGKIIKMDKEVTGILEVPKGDDSIVTDVATYHKYKDKRYLIGELATKLSGEPIDVMNYDGFKEAGPILMSYLLNKFSSNNINKISIGITPAIWDRKEDYKSYLLTELGLEDSKLDLHTQGVSCHFTYTKYGLNIDTDTSKIDMSPKSFNYVGLDLGTNTIDVFMVVNNSLLDYGIKGYFNKGIILVVNKIKEYVFTHLGVKISEIEAKEVLDKGGLRKRGKMTDLSEKITEFIVEYLLNTFELLESEYNDQFNKMDNIILFGGGAEIIKLYLDKSDKIKTTIDELYGEGFLLIPNSNSEYYNTIGYCIQSDK